MSAMENMTPRSAVDRREEIEAIRQWLGGWRSSPMVERYAHLAPDHLAKAATRIDSLLNGYDLATPAKEKGLAIKLTPLKCW